jgi:hypothetical protein
MRNTYAILAAFFLSATIGACITLILFWAGVLT